MLSLFSDWFSTLSLIFGGCCSNAITLEQLTSQFPHSGTLITFLQFLLISLYALPRHVVISPKGYPRMRPRTIPLTPYLIQVGMFYLISLLNNAAFGYDIPMPVHIIFRSGGLVVSLVLGWLVGGKRYTVTQCLSVVTVTLGVLITTGSARMDASQSPKDFLASLSRSSSSPSSSYTQGISLLSLALLLSGFLGLVQDWTWTTYGRPSSTAEPKEKGAPPAWQESLFYLHFLALPMFFFLRKNIKAQFATVDAGPKTCVLGSDWWETTCVPRAYVPLLLNTLTQLFCVAGVHRLNARVSSLTVTLTLVVRKAVSMIISVVWMDVKESNSLLWVGAGLVMLGTVGYSLGSRGKTSGKPEKREKRE